MRLLLSVALWCIVSFVARETAAQPVQPIQALPPPPGAALSPSDMASGKMAAQAPQQAPAQAPMQAAAPQTVTCTVMVPMFVNIPTSLFLDS